MTIFSCYLGMKTLSEILSCFYESYLVSVKKGTKSTNYLGKEILTTAQLCLDKIQVVQVVIGDLH